MAQSDNLLGVMGEPGGGKKRPLDRLWDVLPAFTGRKRANQNAVQLIQKLFKNGPIAVTDRTRFMA
ncbi:MAG: hypothetical protein J0H79_13830 [Alphaproteobacteria bacterium]|nr:hypothetical protein [Alphaproteobacteria bacterium]